MKSSRTVLLLLLLLLATPATAQLRFREVSQPRGLSFRHHHGQRRHARLSRGDAAIGAQVDLEAGGRKQVRETRTGASYLSQSALTLHFGMGAAPQADRLTVPGGGRLAKGRRVVVVE